MTRKPRLKEDRPKRHPLWDYLLCHFVMVAGVLLWVGLCSVSGQFPHGREWFGVLTLLALIYIIVRQMD
jgi:hypothetical protein